MTYTMHKANGEAMTKAMTANFWAKAIGVTAREFRGLSGSVSAISVSHDQRRVVAVSEDRGQFWNAETGQLIGSTVFPFYPTNVRADPTGFWADDGIRSLRVPDADPAYACRLAAPVAANQFEELVGRPSACATVPELMS